MCWWGTSHYSSCFTEPFRWWLMPLQTQESTSWSLGNFSVPISQSQVHVSPSVSVKTEVRASWLLLLDSISVCVHISNWHSLGPLPGSGYKGVWGFESSLFWWEAELKMKGFLHLEDYEHKHEKMFSITSQLLFSCWVLTDSVVMQWTVAHQAPLSMGFPKQGYWSGLPFPSPGDLPQPRDWTSVSCLAGGFFTIVPPGNPHWSLGRCKSNPSEVPLHTH